MAVSNVINKPMASGNITIDDYDELSKKLAMLMANLCVISGEGFEPFSRKNNDIQENYIWCCASLANECHAILNETHKG